MQSFAALLLGAFALTASPASALSADELSECIRECNNAEGLESQGSNYYGEKHCAPYANKRPQPLLVNICTDSYRIGGAGGCERGCKNAGCLGLRFDSGVVASRDNACSGYQAQMPRPAAYEICKESYLKGFEARCSFVEGEMAKAREEEEAAMKQHLKDLEMAVEQNQQEDALAFAQQEQQQQQAAAEAEAAAKAAAEAAAAAQAAAEAKAREHENSLRGATTEAAAVEEPAAPAPASEAQPVAVTTAETPAEQPAEVAAAAPAAPAAAEAPAAEPEVQSA